MTKPFLQTPGVLAMAHRGFSTRGLENSMAAFAAAVDLGYRYVETDVHATSDGVLLAFHDATLDRVSDGVGGIAEQRWRDIAPARIGGTEPIPLLADVLDRWPQLRVNIDIKSAGAVAPLVDLIERMQVHDRVCVTSFSDTRRRAALRGLSRPVCTPGGQNVTTGIVLAQRTPAALRAIAHDVDCLQVPERYGRITVVTPVFVQRMHALGVQVHVWTVNGGDDMRRLLDMGVDGLITDRADLLKDVLQQRDLWH